MDNSIPITELTTLQKVERFKAILVNRSENGNPSATEYARLRSDLIMNPELHGRLPQMVITYSTLSEFWSFIKYYNPTWRGRTEYIRQQFHDLLLELEMGNNTPTKKPTEETLSRLDSDEVNKLFAVAMNRTQNDANGAITAAKSLLESTCKLLLDDMEIKYGTSEDIPTLFKKISTALNLHPDKYPDESLRKILRGCSSIVQGLSETRNRISDAHGQGRNAMNASPRHAKLTVGVAGAMSMFLVETYEHCKSIAD